MTGTTILGNDLKANRRTTLGIARGTGNSTRLLRRDLATVIAAVTRRRPALQRHVAREWAWRAGGDLSTGLGARKSNGSPTRRTLRWAPSSGIAPTKKRGRLNSLQCRLTDKFQLRGIQQDRAVDTSAASASARTITPPPAANAVRPHARLLHRFGSRRV